jgi:hypothetical protein
MGITNPIVFPFYKKEMNPIVSPVALLGFTDNNLFRGDLYDRKLGNWEINSSWKLNRLYNTIICTRCAYFCKDPDRFIAQCHENLNDNGYLYVDWGIGDHWRFSMFKVGWVKDGEHEYAYGEDNKLWSGIWDDSFMKNEECKKFQKEIMNKGYSEDLKSHIYNEIPSVMSLSCISKYFDFSYSMITVVNPLLMYILIKAKKR